MILTSMVLLDKCKVRAVSNAHNISLRLDLSTEESVKSLHYELNCRQIVFRLQITSQISKYWIGKYSRQSKHGNKLQLHFLGYHANRMHIHLYLKYEILIPSTLNR